ncbi:uncharacterized protein HaLaN_11929 [Haematococcus lacustris]|uniref:ATPase AAA-type core domain-containing protein n=1 Tax=Haematococcus lacustris TaxID=44745 RepID=A0A699Z0X8_HAELA|nr:uncharacterized protein HaLaN_11929 [Haematococcus lacustris]
MWMQAAALLADCQQYLDSEAWYAHHGSGKTSLVTALAGSLAMDIYVVTLSSPAMTDETLRQLLNTAGEKCCLLLEDVDAAFVGREGQAGGTAGAITFSGLLNAIDGVRPLAQAVDAAAPGAAGAIAAAPGAAGAIAAAPGAAGAIVAAPGTG